jgi:hypothetical protein
MLSRISFLNQKNALIWLVAFAALTVAIVVAFGRGLNTPFIFDDFRGIKENPSITGMQLRKRENTRGLGWQHFAAC